MPNWCENKLSVSGSSPEFLAYLKEHGLSFGRILPVKPHRDEFVETTRQQNVWGTKWDLSDTEGNLAAADLTRSGEAFFDTPWTPPLAVIEALSRMFPKDAFRVDYHEPGMMFAGHATFANGLTAHVHVTDARGIVAIGREVFGHDDWEG